MSLRLPDQLADCYLLQSPTLHLEEISSGLTLVFGICVLG